MFRTIEREALQHPVTPALRREFLQHEYERQHNFCLLVYAISIAIWYLFDLIVSFQGSPGFSFYSVFVLILLYVQLAALQIVEKAWQFDLFNLFFALSYGIGLRLIVSGLPVALQPVWATLAASTMLYCASVMPLRGWAFGGVAAVAWLLLSPVFGQLEAGPFRMTLLVCYWLFITGIVAYSYYHTAQARLRNFVMAKLLLEQAYRDALTEIPNRRAFMLNAERRMHESAEQRQYLAMVDVDDFKKVNDRYGHDIGDEVLKHVARQLRHVMDGHEYARLGGEEFGIFLHGLTRLEAERAVDELCRQVREAPSEPPVTVSIGLAQLGPGDTLSQALIKADRALYESKHNGKNRFTYAA